MTIARHAMRISAVVLIGLLAGCGAEPIPAPARVNDEGLLAEEVHTASGTFLGNFPQAFSHLGLAGSAAPLYGRRTRHEASR